MAFLHQNVMQLVTPRGPNFDNDLAGALRGDYDGDLDGPFQNIGLSSFGVKRV